MTTFADGESGLSVRTKINAVLQHMDGTAGTLVVNEAGADVDFRVESDTNANAIYMDGATGNVGIGTGTPATKFDVNGFARLGSFDVGFATANSATWLDGSDFGIGTYYGRALKLLTENTERMRITNTGVALIGTTTASGANLLQVNSDASINGLTLGRGLGNLSSNTVLGFQSFFSNTSGASNVAVGLQTLFSNTTGAVNVAVGHTALFSNNVGTGNTAVGNGAMFATTSGSTNTAFGNGALTGNTTGNNNIAIGSNAAPAITTGINNIVIGKDGGTALTTGNNNTIIGSIAGTAGLANTIILGAGTTERMRISSAGNVGIGSTAPTARLQIDDNFSSKNTIVSVTATGVAGGVSGAVHGLYLNIGTSDNASTLYGVYSEINYIGNQPNYAGYFAARGTYAPVYGVYGRATQLDLNGGAIAYGGYFQAAAVNPGSIGDTYAVRAENTAVSGRAAYGLSVSTLAGAATVLPFQILHAGTERLRFDSSGRLLIGTTTASSNNLLQVNSDALINGITVGKGAGSLVSNTALGVTALNVNTTGVNNIAVGTSALLANTTGSGNVAVGLSAITANTTGSFNVGVGRAVLQTNTTGNANTAMGDGALAGNTTGGNNTAVGLYALLGNTIGASNIGIGQGAGQSITTGSNNTIIGSISGTSALVNTIILGAGATERLRINDLGNMGINTTNPTARLDIYDGNINLRAPSYATTARIGFGNPARNDDAAFIQYVGNGNFTGYIAFGTNAVAASVAATEKMRIDPDGNLGIGTTSPGYKLDLTSGAGTSIARFAGPANGLVDVTDGTGTFRVQMLSNVPFVGTFSNHSLVLTTNNTERVRIDTAGNVGVGTASPNAASIIDAQSTTKGVRFPNMTTTQKNAIANVAGNVIFDTTLGKLCVNTGSGWQTITSA
jgi:hypothetical protein